MMRSFILLSCVYASAGSSGARTFWGKSLPGRRASSSDGRRLLQQEHFLSSPVLTMRAGFQEEEKEELSLDEKVYAAMKKLGLESPATEECEGGACPMPAAVAPQEVEEEDSLSIPTIPSPSTTDNEERIPESKLMEEVAELAESLQVDDSIVMAAMGATVLQENPDMERTYSVSAAREMIQQELDLITTIPEDSDEVHQLISEGYDRFLSRRALAFAEMNMDDARAILMADMEDGEEEEQQRLQQQHSQPAPVQQSFKTVTVDADFDPTQGGTGNVAPPSLPAGGQPKPAKKSDVVFEATTAQIQELVLESPVPVLLDVYADWCGPCKVLGPALEEMAVKSGGIFRLVKVNSDNERPVSSALEVTALPTVFGIRDGKIVHMFEGMPRDEEGMKNFMMGLLMPGAKFQPPVTDTQTKKYEELTGKLVKMAGVACFSFSARERLQDRISAQLDKLVAETGDLSRAEESVLVVRSLMANVIKNPLETKYRTVNLANKKISAKIASFPAALAMLKCVGFSKSGESSMTFGKDKNVVNIAPLMVVRDSIDKWIDQSRYDIAKALRKRKDEEDRARLEAEGRFDKEEEEVIEVEVEVVDENACKLMVRMEGKKKVTEMSFSADDSLEKIIAELPVKPEEDDEVQVTCVSKRLVLKSTDKGTFQQSFRELGLSPSAAIVVNIGGSKVKEPASTSKLSERASKKKKKKGSHTMQSIGIYSKDDNAKAELIDGGGGVMYEHDISDDEEESAEAPGDDAVEDTDNQEGGDDSTA